VILITETNVPHEENISYFGALIPGTDQYDEGQMVYQFPLGPLVLHTFHTANGRVLNKWAASLDAPSPSTTFFNFIASHDGIGVMPARGLLNEGEIQGLVERTLAHGGQVSHKTNEDGSKSVYELNITLYDALNDPENPQPELDVNRFLASQAIMLSLAGVPGIYVHSMFGSHNCLACVDGTGRARSINREKFNLEEIRADLVDEETLRSKVFRGYLKLLRVRREQAAFHPNGSQRVIPANDALFALERSSPDGEETILCVINLSPEEQKVSLDVRTLRLPSVACWANLLSKDEIQVGGSQLELSLEPYQTCWLLAKR
jgi:sucrose phosphorylase